MNFKRNIILTSILGVLTLGANTTLNAQESTENPLDTLARSVNKLQDDFAVLKKLKVSGYIQAQFQIADSVGVPSMAGGDFGANVDKRFLIRRGRIKFNYDNKLTQYVLQFDANQTEIRTKEAYVKITEPWLQAVSLQMGIFDLPFGFEVPYSSGSLETPERGRMSQTIFPNENDIGGMITFQMPKTSPLNFLKIEAGMFNGTAGKAVDFDWQKDFVGRISIAKSNKSEKIKYGVGVSYYDGGVRQGTRNVYSMTNDSAGISTFLADKDTLNYGKAAKRQYMGVDAQVSFDFPFGITTLRAEYIQGVQPGTSSTTKSPSAQPSGKKWTDGDAYLRNFNGVYLYFIQNIFQTKHQIVVKYDWYDPNTKVAGNDIGKTVVGYSGKSYAKTGLADLKYSTIGIGYNYKWDNNVKITAYYDIVTNEKSSNLATTKYFRDIPDNVFTLRFQYKF